MDKQPTQIPEEITAEPKEAVKEAPTSEVVLPDEFQPLDENELMQPVPRARRRRRRRRRRRSADFLGW